MLPLLLPLSAGGSTHAGTIVGVMNLAGLTAPFWGHLADSRRLHREVLLVGMLVVLPALLLMPAQIGLPLKSTLACVLGLGFAAANTVANMFIVEVHPPEEWDDRIGALQALSGLGQIVGLLLAGFFGGRYALAFGVAAALVAAAVPTAWLTLRGIHVPTPRSATTAHPPVGGEGWVGSPQRLCHVPTFRGLARLYRALETPFAHLQILWFVAFVAISAVMTMFPLAVIMRFDLHQRVPATVYAFAAAVSLGLYPLASNLAKRYSGRFVLQVGFLIRAAAIAAMAAAFLSMTGGALLSLAGFGVLVMAWPLLGVSGTALTAQLSPVDKGEAIGVFNASSSLAGAVGAFLGGWAMESLDYGTLCAIASVVVALAVVSSIGLPAGRPSPSG
jgi:MFS family permease